MTAHVIRKESFLYRLAYFGEPEARRPTNVNLCTLAGKALESSLVLLMLPVAALFGFAIIAAIITALVLGVWTLGLEAILWVASLDPLTFLLSKYALRFP